MDGMQQSTQPLQSLQSLQPGEIAPQILEEIRELRELMEEGKVNGENIGYGNSTQVLSTTASTYYLSKKGDNFVIEQYFDGAAVQIIEGTRAEVLKCLVLMKDLGLMQTSF